MALKNHTLLIDGNYFLHSRLFVLPRTKGKQLLGDAASQSQLMRKLSIDFASIVRKMAPFVDQIVVAVDSKSWRKSLFPAAEYKGTRTRNDSINWDAVFSIYDEWCDILDQKGVIVNKVQGAEADDVMYGWSKRLNDQGKNCIAWTGDRDLIQLVNHNQSTDAYTLWYYNSKKKLVAFQGFQDMMKLDNVDGVDELTLSFQAWMKKDKIVVQELDHEDFVFGKILQGDKSDNIPSVITWTKESSNGNIRNYSVTEKHCIKILDQYKKEEGFRFTIDHFFDTHQVTKLINIIHKVVGKSNITEIMSRFNQNLNLVLLHHNTIPLEIQQGIYKNIEIDRNSLPIFANIMHMDNILEGSKWMFNKSISSRKQMVQA
tara:strand:+ start:1067 stop:2185 length:1119 start_codon:yes stop_codon:yes gene_type:complete